MTKEVCHVWERENLLGGQISSRVAVLREVMPALKQEFPCVLSNTPNNRIIFPVLLAYNKPSYSGHTDGNQQIEIVKLLHARHISIGSWVQILKTAFPQRKERFSDLFF